MTRVRSALLLGLVAVLAGLSSAVSTQNPLTVGGFIKVSEKRITRTVT